MGLSHRNGDGEISWVIQGGPTQSWGPYKRGWESQRRDDGMVEAGIGVMGFGDGRRGYKPRNVDSF